MGPSRACLLALALGVLLCGSSARKLSPYRDAPQKEEREFDYFMFVRQWPGNYCSKHACPLLHDRGYHFTIHGLWPNYQDGSWPQFCDPGMKFDESKVEDLEDEMEDQWPSFMGPDASFWDHEWSKHGTCALDVLPSEHKFFKTVLKLHYRYDLAAALRAADIIPRRDHIYKASDLIDAIDRAYGAKPLVHCYGKELSEIWMCLDRDLRPFDCDRSHEGNACEELSIPPLRPDWGEGRAGDAAVTDGSESASSEGSSALRLSGGSGSGSGADKERTNVESRQGNGQAAGGATEAVGGESRADVVPSTGAGAGAADVVGSLLASLAAARGAAAAAAATYTTVAVADPAVAAAADEDPFRDKYDTSYVSDGAAEDSVFSVASDAHAAAAAAAAVAAAEALSSLQSQAGSLDGAEADATFDKLAFADYAPLDVADIKAVIAATAAQRLSQSQAERPEDYYSDGHFDRLAENDYPIDDATAVANGGAASEEEDQYGSAGSAVQVAEAAVEAAEAAVVVAMKAAVAAEEDAMVAMAAAVAAEQEATVAAVRVGSAMDAAAELVGRAAAALAALRSSLALSHAAEVAAEAEAPNGGASSLLLGSSGFVWSSRLRTSGPAFDAAERPVGQLAAGGEGADTRAVAVLTDGDGEATWTVSGLVILRSGGGAGADAEAAGGAGVRPSVLSWLVIAQLACVAAIALSLAVLLVMLLATAFSSCSSSSCQRRGGACRQWRACACAAAGSGAKAKGGLAEPLLEAEEGAKGCCGRSRGGGAAAAPSGVVVAADEAAALRAEVLVVLPPGHSEPAQLWEGAVAPQQQQQQPQQPRWPSAPVC